MPKIYDKAQWHIDAGADATTYVKKMKTLFSFLNSKGFLNAEGKEMIKVGIDSSISIHERMLTKEGKEFMDRYYDNVINKDKGDLKTALNKAYKSFTNESTSFAEEREALLEAAENRRMIAANYKELVLHEMLSTALNAIYMTALTRTDVLEKAGEAFCLSRTDKFIAEQGGASALLGKMQGKTYLLSRIASIVEDAAEKAEAEADDEDKAAGNVPEEPKKELFDELDKETDVDAAVELIADRITSAEEEFIRKNAEDKKKIEAIVNDINDRINAVKQDEDLSDQAKEDTEQELSQESARLIGEVYEGSNNVPLFEYMVRKNLDAVLRDTELRKLYQNEAGRIDTDRVIDTTAHTYAFMEFVNTIQLANVTVEYVENIVKSL